MSAEETVNIQDIKPGSNNIIIEGVAASIEKKDFASKPGQYLDIEISDKTGRIKARKWDNIEQAENISVSDVVLITGKASQYRGNLQFVIKDLKKLPDKKPQYYLESYDKIKVQTSFNEIKKNIEKVQNPFLQKLIKLFLQDSSFIKNFLTAPAAKGYHHNKIGGLVIHTCAVMRVCIELARSYEDSHINSDLLIAGAFFHDIGKVKEYDFTTVIDINDYGKLLGHITIGICMIHEKIKKITNFPSNLELLLKHIILSHHGEFEWGSPKKPALLEALILHYADNIDAKIEGISMLEREARKKGESWSPRYDGRNFLVKDLENNIEQELF
ncbi:MAG: 3'-5' exoribonuclease YhaM family protein [Candidatus Muiribacteriota bacterium]